MIKNITVIGAGIMGHGIAQMYAQAGKQVCLYDLDEPALLAAKAAIEASLALLIERGMLVKTARQPTLDRIRFVTDLAEAVKGSELITECIPERLDIKHALYAQLETLVGTEVIFASNTSALPVHDLAQGLAHPERLVITHFFNPVQLVPLVEVVGGQQTLPTVVETVQALLTEAHKAVVVLNRDYPGFVANRLQMALAREAFHLIEEHVASAEDVDRVISEGLGIRWAFAGPLALADLGGLDTWAAVATFLMPKLANDTVPKVLQQQVEAGKLGVKSGEGFKTYTQDEGLAVVKARDEQFIDLLKIKGY